VYRDEAVACPTILLWDIDGTLVKTAGVGRRALERVFTERYGCSAGLRDVAFDGMTDRAIVRRALAAIGQAVEGREAEAAIDGVLAAYVPLLEAEIAETPEFRLHPGVHEALDAAAARGSVAIGLGTGNIRAGARAKLRALGIFERFRFGGFGCDHEERGEILRIGAARGARVLGLSRAACRVVVIGDTPRDVAAARAIGAESIGVGSSRFAASELLATGATHAFADLTDPGFVSAVLPV
jgi:phosphoglycolate phosphatase